MPLRLAHRCEAAFLFGESMSAHIYCFMSGAGPSAVVEDFHATLMSARKFWAEKGWHWEFGLCDPSGIAPIINDSKVKAENRPPGESYVLISGIWLCRDWDANRVGLAMNTIASLWPELTLFFAGQPYEEYRGYRGLWQDGQCVVFDARVDEDNPDRDENGNPLTLYRRVHPTAERPIPLFYQHDFVSNDPFPAWDELRKSIAESSLNEEEEGRYMVQLRDCMKWRDQEDHDDIDEARESARSYSRHCDVPTRIVDTSTGEELEQWYDGQLEAKNGELL
jgi:hypothetical protein